MVAVAPPWSVLLRFANSAGTVKWKVVVLTLVMGAEVEGDGEEAEEEEVVEVEGGGELEGEVMEIIWRSADGANSGLSKRFDGNS